MGPIKPRGVQKNPESTREMDGCPCPERDPLRELKKKEKHLEQKEKEILKMRKMLQKRVIELKKKRDTKAKADLKAAKKLNRARKKLQLVIDATDKIGKPQRKTLTSFWGSRVKKKQSCASCDESQRKWFDKIHSMLEKFHNSTGSCFCEKTRGFSDMCRLYFKKIVDTTCACEDVCARYDRSRRDYCHKIPCRSKRYSCLESAAGDCYEMAMGRTPNMWAYHPWPVMYPRHLSLRTQRRNLGLCLSLIAGFLFWSPCLLCIALCKCFCCSCCSDC